MHIEAHAFTRNGEPVGPATVDLGSGTVSLKGPGEDITRVGMIRYEGMDFGVNQDSGLAEVADQDLDDLESIALD